MSSITSDSIVIKSKKVRRVSWGLQIFAAAAFSAAAVAKLLGIPMMVAIFDHIGLGQWFRIFTGIIEIAGSIALLIPASTAFGALLLSATMFFGVLTHLFVIGGNPVPAIILLVITGTIAWLHRARFQSVLRRT